MFIGTLPKWRLAGENVTAVTPVPARVTAIGPLGEELITVTWPPEVGPAAVGANMIPITQLEFAARVPLTVPPAMGQVVVALVSSVNGPFKTSWVRDSTAA